MDRSGECFSEGLTLRSWTFWSKRSAFCADRSSICSDSEETAKRLVKIAGNFLSGLLVVTSNRGGAGDSAGLQLVRVMPSWVRVGSVFTHWVSGSVQTDS